MAEKNHNPYSTQQRSISGINAFASPDFNVELLNYDRFLETKSGDKRKPVIYGETRTGGILVFQDLVGPNKDYLLQVYTVSEGEIHSVPAVYVNGSDSRNSMFSATVEQIKGVIVKKHPFQKTTIEYDIKYQSFFDTLQVTSGSQRTIYTQVSTGRTDYTTTPLTIAKLSPKWDDTFQGNGSAAVAVLIDLSAFDVEPKIEFNIKGQLVRDIRTESNEKVWSNNPALCLYDYLTNSRYGAGKDPSVFDINSFIEQAAVCDQVINLKTGQNLLANTSAKTTIRESDSTLGGKVINIGPSRFRSRARTDLHRGHIINDGYDVVGLMATNSSAENTQRAQAFNKQIFEQAGYQITDPILLVNTLRYKSGGLTSGGDYYGYAIIINANGEYVAALAGNEDVEVTVELAVKNKPVGDVEESARFSFNGIIDQSETVKDNVEKMLSEMNATLPPYNGLTHLKCHVPSTVVKTFDLSNIIGDIEYEFGDSDTKYNGVQATYRDPNFGYTNQSVVTIDNSYDGGDSNSKEFKELNLNFCNSYGRAHYLASMFLNKSKLQDSIKFTSTHVGIQYQVGNIIRVNDTKNNIDRAYSIVDKIINTDSTVTLLCLVYDTGIFEVLQLNIPYDANLPLTTTTITESLDPVTDFTVKQVAFDVAGSADLSWKASAAVDHFNIEYKTTGQYKLLAKTNDLSFRAVSLKSGAYTFRIRACNKLETLVSDYVSATLNINTNVVEFPSVSNMTAEFTSVDAVVKWDDLRNTAFVDDSNPLSVNNSTYRPFISGYEVRVYSGTSLRRTEVVTDPSYRYTLDKNAADGLKRSIKFVVRTINTMNQTGSATATVTVVNNQIAAPIDVVVNVDYDTFYASTFKPTELDYNGTQFHMSKTQGYTPSSSTLVADVRSNTFSKSLSVGKWYCRIGHYDVFDALTINFSAEKEVVLTEVTLADIDVDGIIAGINESLQNEAVERARVDIQNAQDALLLVTQEASDRAAAIQAETVARTNAVAKEASDRATAITTAVASETSARNTAITTEATTRANAITAEASARHDALIAEASARGTAISNEAKSRSDADGALSSRVDVISAATGSNAAAITAEATARTNADSALSTRVDSVLAKSNANSASISSEVTARTNADSALSTRVDSVLAKSDANSASITSLTKTVTDNNSATATRIDTVEATALTQAQAAETSAKTFATASVNTEKNARITADSALTTRIDTVTATADKNKADIVTVNTALTTKEAALASSINTVQANVDGVDGKLTTEKTARTTADTALSTRIDTVTATANKNKADIVTVNTAFATADTALSTRIDTVTATANKNKADIVTVNTALTTKEAALAQSITNVQANVDGVDGKLTTEKTARTSADTALSTRIDTVTATANKNKADIVTVNTALADANTAFASSLTSMETAVKADATTKADAAKAAALVAAATDASTKANNALAAAKTDATTKANSAESNAKVAAATDAAAKAAQALVDAKSYADTKKTEAATYTNSKYDAAVSLINQKDSAQATALTNMETSVKTDSTTKANQALNDALAQSGGTNLLNISSFTSNGNKGGWSSGSVVAINSVTGVSALDGRTHALMLSTRDNYEYQNPIPVVAGETIYWGAWINTQATSNRVNFGYRKYANGVAQNSWITSTFLNGNTGWTWVQGSQVMHADATSIVPFLQISATSNYGTPLVQDIVISRSPVRAGALAAKDSLSASDVGADPAGSAAAAQQAAQTYSNGKYDQAVTLINQKDTAQSTKTSTLEAAVGYSLSEINNQEANWDFKRGTLNWDGGEVVSDAEVGKCLEVTGHTWASNSVLIPVDPTRTYRYTAKIKQQTISGAKISYLGVRTYDANYNELLGGAGTYRYCAKAGGDTPSVWTTYSGDITGVGSTSMNQFRTGTCYVQIMLIGNYNGGSGKCRFADFKFEDVTEQLAVNAKITQVENAVSTKDSAMATRVTNMETSLKTDATNKANTAETNAKNAAATYTNTKYNDAVTLINNKDSAQTSALTSMETSLKTDSTNKVNAASEIASSIYNLIPDAGFEKPFVNGVPVGFDSVGSGTISSVNKTSRLESDGWGLDYGGFTGDINQGAPQGTNPDIYYDTFTLPVSVTLGQRLGFSIYTGAHRCKTAAFIYFYNSAGAVVTNSPLDYNHNVLNGGNSLSGYKRLVSYRDVPAGAVYAKGVVRKYNTDQGQSSSYMFYVMPQLSMWGSNQTTPPTWCNTARVDAAIAGADPVGSAAAAQAAAATYTNSKYDQAVTLISNKDSAQTTALTAMEASVRNEINSRGNLLQKYMDNWKIGNHPLDCGMSQNGASDENRFVLGDDPFGSKSVLWEMNTNSNANSDGDGGIGSAAFSCDSKKTYRYSLFVKKSASGGTTYLGCSGGATQNLNGTSNNNPYFWAGGLGNDKWYLLVGVLQPDSGTVNSNISGVYDCETGQRVIAGTDFRMTAGATTQILRAYLYYSTNINAKQYFWGPRVDVVDGSEPSLSSLMPNVATNALSKYIEVVDLVTAKDSAMATRVDGLSTTVGNNTSSVNTLSTSVNGLKAEYTVKVNSVGHVAGIGLSSGPMGSAFIAQADRIVLANSAGGGGVAPFKLVNNVVYLNTAVIQNASITTAHVGQLEASNIKAGAINASHIAANTITGDKILAGTKIQSPIIEGGQIYLLGTNYMEISSATPFGPDGLIKWSGPRLMNGTVPNWGALRKSNATQYVTATGDAYYGGSLSAGVLKNDLATTLLTPYTVGSYLVEVGPFSSNGKAKNVIVSYNMAATYSSTSAVSSPTQPKLQWQLERSINSGAWTAVSSGTYNGTTSVEYDYESRRYLTMEHCSGSTTFTDNTTTVGTYAYRIKVLAYIRYHATSNVTSQVLSLISTEQ